MGSVYKEIEGIQVGKARVRPTTPTHVRGNRAGNDPGNYERSPGHLPDGRSTARRSTGINPRKRDPILGTMPNLSPP
jgi:hypothetical protein